MTRFIAIVLLLLIAIPVIAQDDAPDVIPPELDAHLDALVSITEQIRGLDTITPIERAFPTREDTIAYLTQLYDEALSLDDWQRQAAFYGALDLLPDDVDLRDLYLTLLGSQVAGFYDTETRLMNVLPLGFRGETNLALTEQIIFIHEYTHALQDQHFQIDSLTETADESELSPDQSLAITSLIEGDASAVMTVYSQEIAMQNPLAAVVLLAETFQSGGLTLPEGTPGMLVRELTFPYEAGMSFVTELYQAGGWEAVNAAYANLPISTEQILHPEKYLSGEAPLIVDYTLSDTLPDWTSLYDTTLGEFYLREHLRSGLNSLEARDAAAGWGGDRFQLLINPETGDQVWTLTALWDTVDDANEFFDYYVELGAEVFGEQNTSGERQPCWTSEAETRCLMRVRTGAAGDDWMIAILSTTNPDLMDQLIWRYTG